MQVSDVGHFFKVILLNKYLYSISIFLIEFVAYSPKKLGIGNKLELGIQTCSVNLVRKWD